MNVMMVMFRRERNGNVFACFPYESGSAQYPNSVSIYDPKEGHVSGDRRWVVEKSRPAKPAEYDRLRRHLESLGYALMIMQPPHRAL
jgi:hypothetical protein